MASMSFEQVIKYMNEMKLENERLREENGKLREGNNDLGYILSEGYFCDDLHIIGGSSGPCLSVRNVLLKNNFFQPCKICGYFVSTTHDNVHHCYGERKCFNREGRKCTETKCRCFRKDKKCQVKDCDCREIFDDELESHDPRARLSYSSRLPSKKMENKHYIYKYLYDSSSDSSSDDE